MQFAVRGSSPIELLVQPQGATRTKDKKMFDISNSRVCLIRR
jgi:hypothetical protein